MIPVNEVLKELGYAVGFPVFTRRLRSYIKQSEVGIMKFQNCPLPTGRNLLGKEGG